MVSDDGLVYAACEGTGARTGLAPLLREDLANRRPMEEAQSSALDVALRLRGEVGVVVPRDREDEVV